MTVIDNIDPTITCPGNQIVSYDNGCQFNLQDYTGMAVATDNCSGLSITQSPLPGTVLNASSSVTLTVTDGSGNTNSCSFTVTPNDTTIPNAVCQDITVQLDPSGTINISPLNVDNGSSDNCGIQSMTVSPSVLDCSNIGQNTVTLTVTDTSGNVDTCTSIVTVEDVTPPNASCGSITVTLDSSNGLYTLTSTEINSLYTGTGDSCSSVSLSLAQTTFDCDDIGVNNVQLTISDTNGNSSSCFAQITVEAPIITSGTLTGLVVDPVPDNPVPADDLIEVTACPGGIAIPKDVQLTLNLDASSTITASNITTWQISTDDGQNWSNVAGTLNLLQYTLLDLTTTTLVRLEIQSGSCVEYSPLAVIRFLPPDEPPIITSVTNTDICLGDSVIIEAESFFESGGQFEGGGDFNNANPEGWAVDGIEGDLNASGNNTNVNRWKETNGPTIFGNLRYDTADNTKFAIANGPLLTTLETPVFNTVGMTAAEAVLEFYQAYYFCPGAEGRIELSTDGGANYNITLTTDQNDNYVGPNDSGFAWNGNNCGNGPNGRAVTSDPLQFASIDMSSYIGMSNLRIRFTFDAAGVSSCTDNFPIDPGYNCNINNTNETVVSSWVLDDVGFPYAAIDEELEWTDEDGNVVATGSSVSVTPVTPGVQEYGVTALVNGCRADTDDGTEFITINTSLAYAGPDFAPSGNNCGQSTIDLRAYDNTLTAVQNFNNGAYESGLYTVPDVNAGDTDYTGTGITGTWSIESSTNSSCGTSATLSSMSNPYATFTADPGTYTLRWTLSNGCFDEVTITINNCNTIDFDGVDDFVTFKNNYSFSGDFSLETWIKPHSVNGIQTVFSKRNGNTTTEGYNLNIENGTVIFYWYSSSGHGNIRSQHTIDSSRWYHVAITFDGSTYQLFIDGINLGTIAGSINAPDSTGGNVEALLGAIDMDAGSNNTVSNFYNGWIDEVRIWNVAISQDQLRQMMNQEIDDNTLVVGESVPLDIPGLNWSALNGYYRMDVSCGALEAYKGVRGRLRNITTSQQNNAPLPYTSRVDGQTWGTDNTWTHFNVWDAPNSIGIDGVTPIDWNIVQTSHSINSGDRNITVLGLISDTANKTLAISDPGTPQNELNNGEQLRVTHYLKLDGIIDLFGESQLLQDENSVLDPTSSGYMERDQQGTTNLFNYNYWSSPVSPVNNSSNNTDYHVDGILRDGTNSNAPLSFLWTSNHDADGSTTPKTMSRRWIFSYEDFPENSYSDWNYLEETGTLSVGLGFTMKGSGAAGSEQNYVFTGKPNNGTITSTISSGYQTLVGNPYPSAIDANTFILNNIPGPGTGSIDGTIYFWEHYTSNLTHTLEDYEGGYAAYNLTGGVSTVIPDGISGNGSSSKTPGRYIPVGQGFFVTASPTGGTVTFNNGQRSFVRESIGNSVFMDPYNPNADDVRNAQSDSNSEEDIPRIRIEFTSEDELTRPLLIGFTPDNAATDGFDFGYDALFSDQFANDMFWLIDGEKYIIQGVGAFDNTKQYPLGLFLSNSGNIQISLTDIENFDTDIDVYIYDAVLDIYTSINVENYQIYLNADDYTSRFYLAFSADPLNIGEFTDNKFSINYLLDSNELYIYSTDISSIEEIELFNVIGQQVYSWKRPSSDNGHELRLTVKEIPDGPYIVKVVDSNGWSTSKKVIIKR